MDNYKARKIYFPTPRSIKFVNFGLFRQYLYFNLSYKTAHSLFIGRLARQKTNKQINEQTNKHQTKINRRVVQVH